MRTVSPGTGVSAATPGIGYQGNTEQCAAPGTGESATAVLAIRALPQQQQLLLCAAMRLLGAPAPDSPGPSGGFGTPCRVAQVRAPAAVW